MTKLEKLEMRVNHLEKILVICAAIIQETTPRDVLDYANIQELIQEYENMKEDEFLANHNLMDEVA